MKNPILAILILFSTFAMGQNDSAEAPKIAVKVPLGKTIVLHGISIKFAEVMEDSRCPEGVSCIWAGRAIVKLEISINGNNEEKTMIFGETKPGETKNHSIFDSEQFSIDGLKLDPYPSVETSGKNLDYVLLVTEKRK